MATVTTLRLEDRAHHGTDHHRRGRATRCAGARSTATTASSTSLPSVHTVPVGSKGIRRRKPRRPLTDPPDDGAQMLVADAPNEYSTMTPYGAAMGMATFVGKLIRRVTGEDRRR